MIEDREDFSSYLELSVSEDSKEELIKFFDRFPHIKEEVFEQSKNYMANTIYKKNQSKEYIDGVYDTLKYIKRLFSK